MSKALKNYDRCELGYYINYVTSDNTQPFQIVGTYTENATETPGASYINDDWFIYITSLAKNPRPIINGNTLSVAENEISIIDDFIMNNYSRRCVFSDDFSTWCDYDYKPATVNTISAPLLFQKITRGRVRSILENKREEYIRLWEIQTSEYNPLNDYDDFERVTHSGTDTSTHSGTDTTAHSGKDTTQNSGTDTTTKTGSETLSHTGYDTVADSGSDTATGSTYAFDSVSEVNKDKNVNTYGKSTQTTYNDSNSTTYNNVADSLSHGLKTELTHGESVALTHGESVANHHGEVITREKSGSTLSPSELLTKHREMWENFNILQTIANDIILSISV